MTDQEILQKAVKFQLDEDVFVEKRGMEKWCVTVFGTVLDYDLNRYYEPLPSNRTEEFVSLTRFSLKDAFDIANRYIEL